MPRRRRKSDFDGPQEEEDWLVTYADAITLLMAFFVMLVSFSKVDLMVFADVQRGIKEQLGGTVDNDDSPIFSLESELANSMLDEASEFPPDQYSIGFDDEGLVIDFASGSFFKPGSAELTEPASRILAKMYEDLNEPPYDTFLIDVEGHTDNVPIATDRFASNWELSTARAARVVRHFIELGMKPKWLRAVGYADTKPKLPNTDLMGNPIPENQKKNRRVTLRLRPSG